MVVQSAPDGHKPQIIRKQLVPPVPMPSRACPYKISCNDEWLVYGQGRLVFMRPFPEKGPEHRDSREYREHAYAVTAVKLSPDGEWAASGGISTEAEHIRKLERIVDANGFVRVWSTASLKTRQELQVLSSAILDISWSPDGRNLFVCGESRSVFVAGFRVEDGSSLGEFSGPTKRCRSISAHSNSDGSMQCLVGSEDGNAYLYTGKGKLKFAKTLVGSNSGFVHAVAINSDGCLAAVGGSDGTVRICRLGEGIEAVITEKAHDGGIMGMEWLNKDEFITISTDQFVRHWKMAQTENGTMNLERLHEHTDPSLSKQFTNHLLALAINSGCIVTMSYSGVFEALDRKSFAKTGRSLSGHQKGLVDLKSRVAEGRTNIFSLSYDGSLVTWDLSKENGTIEFGARQGAGIAGNYRILAEKSGALCTIGLDNGSVQRLTDGMDMSGRKAPIATVLETSDSDTLTVSQSGFVSIGDAGKTYQLPELPSASTITCGAMMNNWLVVAAQADNAAVGSKLLWYRLVEGRAELHFAMDHPARVTALSMEPNGQLLAVADDQRHVKLLELAADGREGQPQFCARKTAWCHHSSRIDQLLWLDGQRLVSAGVDGDLLAWDIAQAAKPLAVCKGAHASPITGLAKTGTDTFYSVGADATLRAWSLTA